ncbi:MAG: ComF family protein [Lachnospiraceae bacterium]|nr:ComF family protein [Lachnospiraceae bacterium]
MGDSGADTEGREGGRLKATPIIDLIFPRRCPVCQDIVALGNHAGLICPECRDKLPYVKSPCCMKCGKELESEEQEYCGDCRRIPKHYVKGYPLFNYVEPVQNGVMAFKYHNRREYAEFYGEEIWNRFEQDFRQIEPDGILPVPLHWRKQRSRGYNQAELVARYLSRQMQVPMYSGLLVRRLYTTPQKELNDKERLNNLKKAFLFHKNDVKLNRILLVDDIYTTGATVEACTEVLRQAGIEQVYYTSICIGKSF